MYRRANGAGRRLRKARPTMDRPAGLARRERILLAGALDVVRRVEERVDTLVGQGHTVAEACREANVTESVYYRWRRRYRALGLDQAARPGPKDDGRS